MDLSKDEGVKIHTLEEAKKQQKEEEGKERDKTPQFLQKPYWDLHYFLVLVKPPVIKCYRYKESGGGCVYVSLPWDTWRLKRVCSGIHPLALVGRKNVVCSLP